MRLSLAKLLKREPILKVDTSVNSDAPPKTQCHGLHFEYYAMCNIIE